jgi:phosphopantetheine adenylyltransferase
MSRDDDAVVTEEEVDVLSLLATESEPAENEDSEENVDIPDTVEELKALLEEKNETIHKRNVSLRKAKAAQGRTQEEKDAFVTRLDALEQRGTTAQPNVEAENLAKEEQEWLDRVEDDPTQITAYMNWKNAKFEGRLVSYLDNKFGEFDGSLAELRVSPEKTKYAKEIAALKSRDGFANLDDDTLITVIKGLEQAKVKQPRGTAKGGKVASIAPTEVKVPKAELLKMGFPGD